MIKLNNFSKRFYDNQNTNNILNDINITFKNKGLYYVVGNNGTGKSTIFNILLGKDLDYEGSYFFNNQNMKLLNQKR